MNPVSLPIPQFKPSGELVPLESRVAGLTSEELLEELKHIVCFMHFGYFSRHDTLLRNQIFLLLELRDVPERVIEAAVALGRWEGERIGARFCAPETDDATD